MNNSFSQNLLLAIVHGLRSACKKNIQSDNFTVVSGFISCDIDGKVQHRFVINELINSDNSGEGHSSCLKIIDWNYLSRRLSSHKNDSWKHCSINQSPLSQNYRSRSMRGGQIKNRFGQQAATKIRQDAMQKCLSGPVSQCQFTDSRNKRNNQTFTLEDFQLPPSNQTPECNLTHNFSSDAVSLISQNISTVHRVSPKMKNIQAFAKPSSSYRICRSISPALRSLCPSFISDSDIFGNDNPGISCINNNLSHQMRQKGNCSQVRINRNFIVAEIKKMSQKKYVCSKVTSNVEKSSRTQMDHSKLKNATNGSRINCKPLVKQNHSSNSGDSDINIDSIRPRYLVKHNDELLLPCPNFSSKYNKHMSATKNNNRTHHLPSQSSDEDVPNAPHLSSLLNSIIGALSHSGYINVHEAANKKCAVSLGLRLANLKNSDNVGESSSDSLKSVSSIETDSLRSCLNKATAAAETSHGRPKSRTEKMSYSIRHTYNKKCDESFTMVKKK